MEIKWRQTYILLYNRQLPDSYSMTVDSFLDSTCNYKMFLFSSLYKNTMNFSFSIQASDDVKDKTLVKYNNCFFVLVWSTKQNYWGNQAGNSIWCYETGSNMLRILRIFKCGCKQRYILVGSIFHQFISRFWLFVENVIIISLHRLF